jgi:hypothetical protein
MLTASCGALGAEVEVVGDLGPGRRGFGFEERRRIGGFGEGIGRRRGEGLVADGAEKAMCDKAAEAARAAGQLIAKVERRCADRLTNRPLDGCR